MAKNRPRGKNQVPTTDGPVGNTAGIEFWRQAAGQLIPKETDESKIGEVATGLAEMSQLLGSKWAQIDRICDRTEGKCISIGFVLEIDRGSGTPSEVSTKISYSEKYSDSLRAKVPDPSQGELDFNTTEPA